MKLNCDLGESFGAWKMGLDEQVMPWIDMANIACGFHASDPDVMAQTISLALKHNVTIGAHPGYADKQGFGRRSIPHTMAQISHLVAYQVGALQALCRINGAAVEYVKPHGALYNDMMRDKSIFKAVVAGVAAMSEQPKLMVLARSDNSDYQRYAEKKGVTLLFEAFADRAYSPLGELLPRTEEGAVFHQSELIIEQVMTLSRHGYVTAINGERIPLQADSVCVHGDNPESVAMVQTLSQALKPPQG